MSKQETTNQPDAGHLMRVAPSLLTPSGTNPRTVVTQGKEWEDLVRSVRATGIAQPPVVRSVNGGAKYQIVCGERRWRAAMEAKLETIPVLMRELTDEEAVEIQQVENLQRADLTPLEEAKGFEDWIKRLMAAPLSKVLKLPGNSVWGKDSLYLAVTWMFDLLYRCS